MYVIALTTLRGYLRDKIAWSVLLVAILFCGVPFTASLSMRQVTELSLTLSLSLVSFVLLVLSVFFGGTSLWKDIERRYTFSVISLPISRSKYLLGKFFGTAAFLTLITLFLIPVALAAVYVASHINPPDRPVLWATVLICIGFDLMKYILLVACAFLFSTVSTSFFLPIFGAILTFFAGSMSQQVFDYIHSDAARALSPTTKLVATFVYYVLPNFSAVNLNLNAVYALPRSLPGVLLTASYFVAGVSLLLALACLLFNRREMN